ncbi:endolytic transglycosylase MltG [Candidatus Roizmanbacteria bacterium CG_4_10_14_0_8_um_filter_39_9]|uniref:Endolytic murein transglycosylase n=1 Tax=Candidatus Roizmanbacteria bacterium CG_4_10_14_0_8_um_filter_39_9 TaxID=1974829 RepID=A0A2M7QBH3_9BACT|nr:MAG: endolytic transglycosylase MltG [Candidatus Roizmanbacteria bacterium CG_4_10_14_0_8_um_filter_39_9]
MKKVRLFIIIFVLILLGGYIYFQQGSLPMDKNNQGVVLFTVKNGEGLNSIVKNLKAQNIIRGRFVFYITVKLRGIEKKIQAGEFRLSKRMTAQDVASELTHGTADVWVTAIEGTRDEEIAENLAAVLPISKKEFIEKAREGYLFPDTYLIPKMASVDTIISIFQKNFDEKYTTEIKNNMKRVGLSEHQAIIVASLIEREARFPEDKKKVAGILIKRFKSDWALQLDATIQYALGYQRQGKTWWKKDLTREDLNVDSTYNTYKYPGLPPAPICNPGLESILAVSRAEVSTPYWYYISDKKGVMHYAKTLEEHNANVETYLQ